MREIERRFILNHEAIRKYLDCLEPVLHMQWYAAEPHENRIRVTIDHSGSLTWTYTQKQGVGMIRYECEETLSENDPRIFSPLSKRKCVIKLRYTTHRETVLIATIDRYLFPDIGCVGELEVGSSRQFEATGPLEIWQIKAADVNDVTDRRSFTAANIACYFNRALIDDLRTNIVSLTHGKQIEGFENVLLSKQYCCSQ